jgi:signal recognition particle subunit SRP54
MFDQLSERLQGVFSKFGASRQLTEENMDEALREIRRALLEADVNLRVIKAFLSRVKDRAVGENILKSLDAEQQLVGIVHEEMVALLGGESKPILDTPPPDGQPSVLVLFGLQGSGKTTTAGKLALKLKKEGKKPFLIAADVYRPAAIQQLKVLGQQVDAPVFMIDGSTDVLEIVHKGLAEAKAGGYDPVLIDTAGRLQIDTGMMAELLLLERTVKPQEKLLVVDAMTGQEAVTVAEAFNAQLDVTGLVLTKLDGDARGGAALSIVEATGKPVKLIGVSEKLNGLETFHPERMASRILGMGDVLSLVEKAQAAFDIDESKRMEAKMRKQEFTLEDFMKLQKQLKMLGSLDQILGMLPIPGLTKDMREMIANLGEGHFKKIEVIVNSLTRQERQKPSILVSGVGSESRIRRIAKGCGLPEAEITQFLKQFEQMRMMMTQFTRMMGGGENASDDDDNVLGMGGSPSSGGANTMGLSMPRSSRKKNKDPNQAQNDMLAALMKNGGAGMPKMPGTFGSNLPGKGGWPFGSGKKK